MNFSWKVILPLAVVIVIAGALVFTQFGGKSQKGNQVQPKINIKQDNQAGSVLPVPNQDNTKVAPATGNVDDVVGSLLQDAQGDTSAMQNATNDTSLLNSDSQAVSDFGQSYDANSF